MRRKWLKYVSIGLVPVVAVFFMTALYGITEKPSFCGNCHEMKPYVLSWQKSTHRDVKCAFCHEKRGFQGKIEGRFRAINEVYLHVANQYTITERGKMYQENCKDCHLKGIKYFPDASRLDKKHFALLKKGWSCLSCHKDPGHKTKIFTNALFK